MTTLTTGVSDFSLYSFDVVKFGPLLCLWSPFQPAARCPLNGRDVAAGPVKGRPPEGGRKLIARRIFCARRSDDDVALEDGAGTEALERHGAFLRTRADDAEPAAVHDVVREHEARVHPAASEGDRVAGLQRRVVIDHHVRAAVVQQYEPAVRAE